VAGYRGDELGGSTGASRFAGSMFTAIASGRPVVEAAARTSYTPARSTRGVPAHWPACVVRWPEGVDDDSVAPNLRGDGCEVDNLADGEPRRRLFVPGEIAHQLMDERKV